MNNPEIIICPTLETLADNFVKKVKEAFDRKDDNDFVTIALSGGSTPGKVFQYVSENYHELPFWKRVRFFWGDERCVPPNNDESNFKMAHDTLLAPLGIPDINVFRVLGELDPEESLKHYRDVLRTHVDQVDELPQFDLILLGLGDDGHTASLFPGDQKNLQSTEVCELALHPVSGQKRVTLTLPVINHARSIVFLVTGAGKMEMVRKILGKENYPELPVTHVRPTNGKITWCMDNEAAGLL